jgi:hypothetical protein
MESFKFDFPLVLKVLGFLREIMESKTPYPGVVIGGIKSIIVPTVARYIPRFRMPIFGACRPASNKTIVYLKDFNTYEIVNVQDVLLVYSAPFGKIEYMSTEVLWRKSHYNVGRWGTWVKDVVSAYESLVENLPASLQDLEEWKDFKFGYGDPFLSICGIPVVTFNFIKALYDIDKIEIVDYLGFSKHDAMAYLKSIADRFKKNIGDDFPTAIENLLFYSKYV